MLAPLTALPQVIEIWYFKNAAGVSSVTWGCLIFVGISWLTYAITHKEKPLIIMYSFWIVIEITIFSGTLLYG